MFRDGKETMIWTNTARYEYEGDWREPENNERGKSWYEDSGIYEGAYEYDM
jgi:hypothetical protein